LAGAVREKNLKVANIRTPSPSSIKLRRTLKGHFGKVTAMHWAGDSIGLLSGSQDGKLILWNAVTTNKLQAISLKSNYVMTVGLEQSRGNLAACGGLDNLCSIYRLTTAPPDQAPVEMASHDGFLSCCRFVSEDQILTASGDSTIILWDVATAKPVETFSEHKADVMFLSIQPQSQSVFVTGSVDRTCKVWDTRSPKAASVQTFSGFHQGDINSVDFCQQDTQIFASGSGDGTARVFDLRSHNQICCFGKLEPEGCEGITSVSFSRSGRLLFAGHVDSNVMAWDLLADDNNMETPAFMLSQAHDQHVSCVAVNPKGDALCTGSWDSLLKIWA
jgi:guanine nucleotide-binding protein G(I)/G(S)/G(T) subunit beta-1